jgi:hypothetical protein
MSSGVVMASMVRTGSGTRIGSQATLWVRVST